jgi:murein DD-endopeptidase MepM/ murein hydrolase activator NlpD
MAAGKQPVAGEGGKGGTYTVKAGDSLNRIAKANGVSVEELRKANGLTTAAIRIGQTLKVPGADTSAPDQVVTASVPGKTVDAKAETKLAKTEEAKPAQYTPPVAKESVTEVASKDDGSEASPKGTGISKYRWPVRGQVIAGYGANVEGNRNDGINISVPEGTPIKAAENGVVIYSGSSLKELGNAVLVRHDDGTVTVYGNASELKVQRGQKIQRGQTLAASGMSGTATQPQVHFEVRKNASAVNPATFLE